MTVQLETELEEKELEKVAGGIAGELGMILGWHLAAHVYPNQLGRVFNSQTDFELPGIGKKQPDLAFVSIANLPVNTEDAVPVAPDLAVEIISKTDDWSEIIKKVSLFQAANIKLTWVVDFYTKSVFVFRLDRGLVFETVRDEQELDGEKVVPGFRLKVSVLFQSANSPQSQQENL